METIDSITQHIEELADKVSEEEFIRALNELAIGLLEDEDE